MCRIAAIFGAVALAACDAGATERGLDPDAARGDDAGASGDARFVDAATAPDAEVLPAPDADPCPVPSYGAWVGTASRRQDGRSDRVTSAEIRWELASSVDCVDRFAPSGTTTFQLDGSCDHTSSHAIAASDGWLAIDRRTAPATWRAIGSTTWAGGGCAGTVNAAWIDASGVLTGPVIDGVVHGGANGLPDVTLAWHLRPDGMTFPAPAGCVEPARDTWTFGAEVTFTGTQAEVTWTRVSTTGCTDTFTPSGTARQIPIDFGLCEEFTMGPTTATIEADDGALIVDRATNPPTYVVTGRTTWPGTSTCRFDDGHTETYQHTFGGSWAMSDGAYAGDQVGGMSSHLGDWWSWRFGGAPGELP